MASVYLPDHRLIRHPAIIRRIEPPMLVNGGVVVEEGDLKIVAFYREAAPMRPAAEVLTVAMTDADFTRSMLVAATEYLPRILATSRMAN